MTEQELETSRGAGRPRTFSDEDFFDAVARVLSQVGHQSLTLEAVALEAGSSRPALNRRFGDKQGLLKEFVEWIVDQVDSKFEQLEDAEHSPLEILRAGSFAFSTGIQGNGQSGATFDPSNQLRFFINAWTDPVMRPLMTDLATTFEGSVARYLRAAVDSGELKQCDVQELAYLLSVTGIGSLLRSVDQVGANLSEIHERAFEAALSPYLACCRLPKE